eukprot:GILK01001770.1.p1 GENE.GILK01001770.1~~GILK01001770.1.p1  ORF type:complete len:591 (+),score=105.00 GILK01001770.1:58-1830(+)
MAAAGLSPEQAQWVTKLSSEEYGQAHLFENFGNASVEDKKRLVDQLATLDTQYPGGLIAYIRRAQDLLEASRLGTNPYDGFTPEVPQGERLSVGTPEFFDAERVGLEQVRHAAFVLVAGGLGERLGYNGIKVALPSETTTGTTFMQLYVEHILAFQRQLGADVVLPLAIMTSGDTHELTVKLLADNNNFGMPAHQITIMKQEKVPSLLNNKAAFALKADDPFTVDTKPHGHGDVHTLLHQHGLVSKWRGEGRKWILFFQDTNGLIYKAVPAILGVSAKNNFDINSVTVPRKAGEAAGAICKLTHRDGHSLTINVEYNQLDPLLRSSGFPEGDRPDASGYSPFPGNINVLVFAIDTYDDTLTRTGGSIPEFVNPKYKDATKTEFKTPTRLECMMQDFPKLLPSSARVGFVQFDRWFCFSAVKNNLTDAATKAKSGLPAECASTGEADMYAVNTRLMKLAGAQIEDPASPTIFADIPVDLGARVVLKPSFATSVTELHHKVSSGVRISARSTLVVDGDVCLESLTLDGALVIKAAHGAKVTVKSLNVENAGWQFVPLESNVPEYLKIRGYSLQKNDARVLEFSQPGEHVVSE